MSHLGVHSHTMAKVMFSSSVNGEFMVNSLPKSGTTARIGGQDQYGTHRVLSGSRRKPPGGTGVTVNMDPAKMLEIFQRMAAEIDAQPQVALRSAAASFLQEREIVRKQRTIKQYKSRIRYLVGRYGDRPVSGTWRDAALAILADSKGLTSAGDRRLRVLAAILYYAAARGWRSRDVDFSDLMGGYEPPDRRAYSVEQIRRIWEESLAGFPDATHETVAALDVIRLLTIVPLRAQEATGLRWDEVDFEARRLPLADSKVGARVVPACRLAVELLRSRARDSDWVFPSRRRRGRSVHYNTVRKAFVRILESAGITHGTPHSLRASWSTHAMRIGIPYRVIQVTLGHSKRSTTDDYLFVSDQDLDVAAEKVCAELLGKDVKA